MRRADLIALARSSGFPRISIYIPTHLTYPSIEQDPIRLATALKETEHQLLSAGMRRPAVQDLLAEARDRLPAKLFWRYQEKGLAVLIEPGATHWIKLPRQVPEITIVANRYHLRPMIPMFRDGELFHIFAITRDNIRFFDGRSRELTEVRIAGMPSGIGEIMARTNFQADLGFHARDNGGPASGGEVGKFHALGVSPEDYADVELDSYLREAAKALDRHLAANDAPLVLAAKPRLLGRLRKMLSYRNIADEVIDTDPVALGDERLHSEAWRIAEPMVRADREKARTRLRAQINGGAPAAAKEIQTLMRAAIEGRVDSVFLDPDTNVWGHFDDAYHILRLDPQPSPENEDMLNRLAMETLSRGGDVFTLPDDMRTKAGPAAGLFRY